MKVLLPAINSQYMHTNLAVRYLCASLNENNINAFFKEYSINDNIFNIVSDLFEENCDVYGFSCYIWNIGFVLRVASRLKKVLPSCKVFLGGPEVSFDPEEILEKYSFIDFVICGEGEMSVAGLINDINNPSSVSGVSYRENGKIISNPVGEPVNMDALPFPYTKDDVKKNRDKILYYETSRGCPYNCIYCISSAVKSVRALSLDRVFKELDFFFKNDVKLIKFVDRTFNFDSKRALEILKFCEQNHKNTRLHFEIYPNLLTDEMMDYLKNVKAGIFQFEIGIQTTNLGTLKEIKRVDHKKYYPKITQLIENNNIPIHLDLIAGLPNEGFDSFVSSFNDVYSLKPQMLQLGFLKLLKGTAIRKNADKYNYIFTSEAPYEVLSNDYIGFKEILRLKRVENVLDKLYNSGSFCNFLNNAVGLFENPFCLYDKIAGFAEREEWKRSISKKDWFRLLYEFSAENNMEFLKEYLKLDYFIETNGRNKLDFCNYDYFGESAFEFIKSVDIEKYFKGLGGMSFKDIKKHINFCSFTFDKTYVYMISDQNKNYFDVTKTIETIVK